MKNVDFALSVAMITLLVAQISLLLARAPRCASRKAPCLLAAFLALVAAARIAASPLRDALLLGAFVPGGLFLSMSAGEKGRMAWLLSGTAALLVAGSAALLGFHETGPFLGLRSFAVAAFGVALLWQVFRHWRSSGSILALSTLAAGALWLAGGAADGALRALSRPVPLVATIPGLLVFACTGWLVFEEGYPLRAGWRGRLETGQPGEWIARSMSLRLQGLESALAQRDQVVACGVLATGAAHDFKNALSHMRLAARHALAAADADTKDACLRLLVEQAGAGAESAIAVLERIAAEGREERRVIVAQRDLAGFIATLRASFRGEGILVEADLGSVPALLGRRREIEQILLNITRNAAQMYRLEDGSGRKTITISGRRSGEWSLVRVEDAAGGVPAEQAGSLFSPCQSGHGGTGIGLYLARNLAASNDGTLEYRPTARGSLFTLALPSAGEPGTGRDPQKE